jgi:type II secretory pathway pseudopilin PulG
MAYRMLPRVRQPQAEDGFILIEVLVSAIILALVAGAVLELVTATTRSAANQRTHAVAYNLAQKDQARMRSLRLTTLNRYRNTSSVSVGATSYAIESRGDYVPFNAKGISCSSAHDRADYIQLTSTVSSNALLNPITVQSVVSPSNGSVEPNRGTIQLQTTNAKEEPVEQVEAVLSNGETAKTETEGCATFAELPASPPNYSLTMKGNGLITPQGETQTKIESIAVVSNETTRETGSWDWPGTLQPEFVYTEPGTSELRPAPVDSMWVSNTGSGIPARYYGTPGGTRTASPLASLYPFTSKYAVYAGSCATNNPDPKSEELNKTALASVEVLPKGTVKPRIYIPALELTVEDGTGHPIANATVTVTDSNAACKFGSNEAKRTYKTNIGGHLSSKETGPTEAGLPFGTYNVCASAKFGTKVQSATAEKVKVENLAGTILKLRLAEGGSECA